MHECMDEPEDAVIAKICSVIQGCGGLGSVIYRTRIAADAMSSTQKSAETALTEIRC